MATPAQILANKSNAQHSTGPKSPEGKSAAARNAIKHGMSSAFNVLAHEDQDEFDHLVTELREEHQPATLHQFFLVEQIAKTQWLVARAQRLQTAAFEHLAGVPPDPDNPDSMIVAKMYESNPNALNTLIRYSAQAESSYYKACRELQKAFQLEAEAQAAGMENLSRKADLIMADSLPANFSFPRPNTERSQSGHAPATPSTIHKVDNAAKAGVSGAKGGPLAG